LAHRQFQFWRWPTDIRTVLAPPLRPLVLTPSSPDRFAAEKFWRGCGKCCVVQIAWQNHAECLISQVAKGVQICKAFKIARL
jgi:hypothetical protein